MLWKWSSPHYMCELVICIILRHWLWQVLCALRKNGYLRGCTISRDVSRAAMDTIFRGTYRAPRRLLLIEGRVVCRDRCMDRYVPHGSRTERQRVCIVREDMHHYTWHCISWHYTFDYWWTWTRVLLILWVFLCEACDCWILSCYWECVNW